MIFSGGRSFLIWRRTGFACAFVPSKNHARIRTVPWCWVEHFHLLVLMQTAFGCFYQGMPKLLFRRELRSSRRLRTCLRRLMPLLLLQLLLLQMLMSALTTTVTGSVPAAAAPAAPSTTSAFASGTFVFASTAANDSIPSADQKHKARP
jgi:hypothetical protein